MFFYSPQYFLFICVTAIFSVLCGIILKAFVGDHGVVVAFVMWGAVFTLDFVSTVSVPNYRTHETNHLFYVLLKHCHIPATTSFVLIGIVSLLIQVTVFALYIDPILTYILTVTCICTTISNIYHRKNLLKHNLDI